ncbi:MAG: hypothetical protein AB7V50_10750 [Vampirovibrionia bacterium]
MNSPISNIRFTGKITINAYNAKDKENLQKGIDENPQLVEKIRKTPFEIVFESTRQNNTTCTIKPETPIITADANFNEHIEEQGLRGLDKHSLSLFYMSTKTFAKKCLQYVLKNQTELEGQIEHLKKGPDFSVSV